MKPKDIEALRVASGRTPAHMAHGIGVAPQTWRNWELGKARPMRVFEMRLIKLYKFLFGQEPEEG